MAQNDFILAKQLKQLKESTTNRKKNTNAEAASWLKTQWIRFSKDAPYKMFCKTSLDDNSKFKVLNHSPKRGRSRTYENAEKKIQDSIKKNYEKI